MAKINSVNNTAENFTISPGTATDSYVQFAINASDKWRIGADATDSSYAISQGSALGTNNSITIDTNGLILTPLQSLAINTINSEANVTGDGTDHSIGSVAATTSVVDQNADMTDGNGAGTPATFTAPVTGLYKLFISMSWNGNPVDTVIAFIVTSNRTYRVFNSPMRGKVANFFGIAGTIGTSSSVIADMDASDTAVFHLQGNSGTKNATIGKYQIGAYLLV